MEFIWYTGISVWISWARGDLIGDTGSMMRLLEEIMKHFRLED